MFAKKYATGNSGKRPTLTSIDGGFVQTNQTSFDFNGESNLDLQYGMALVGKQPITLYQTGDDVEGKLGYAISEGSILTDLSLRCLLQRPPRCSRRLVLLLRRWR